ncbi:MAG: hypothetical protein OK442_07055 [Thaumarchaeota archaeon]|nr:hypothetical protein [Nitrososphaerota archaeon]
MKASTSSRLGGISIAVLIVLSAAQAAHADTSIGGTNVWTMVGSPSFIATGTYPLGAVSYSNHLPVDLTAIVIMVLRDNSSQTVYFSTSTVTIAPGAIGTVHLVEFGLNPGTYNATFFAFTFAGVGISLPASAPFTIPG